MKKTQIYLIRHGQSMGNLNNLFLGHTDLDLTELGHKQAEMTASFLKNIPVDAIYSSDLLRAYHTACHTANEKGLPIEKRENLREIYAGEWEEQPFGGLKERYPQSFKIWCENFGKSRCDGGESVAELKERITREVELLAKENLGKTIFIFSHATPIRILKGVWDGVELDDMDEILWPSNASVTHAEYDGEKFKILEYSVDSFMGESITRLD